MYTETAMKNPRLKETHFRFPGTKQLESMFRLEAEDIVSAIAEKKNKGAYASFFHAIEEKVEDVKAKAAKAKKA